MASNPDPHKRLRDEGVIISDLPPEHAAVVDGLTPDELEVIIAVKRRLEEADRVSGAPSRERPELPPFINYMVF